MRTLFLCLALLASGVMLGGCPYIEVRTTTRIYPNGTALREVSICEIDDPNLPPESLSGGPSGDKNASFDAGEQTLLDELTLPDADKYRTYDKKGKCFHALGLFANPNEIPQDYVRPAKYIQKKSANSFSFQMDDYLLFKRFKFSEKYDDIVDSESYQIASEKLLTIAAELYLRVMEKKYGRDYDLSSLEKFLEREALPLARQVMRLNYEIRAQNSSLPADEAERMVLNRIIPLLAPQGLALNLEEDNDQRVKNFVALKHAELLKPKRQEVGTLSVEQARSFVQDDFEKMFQEAAVQKFGSEEAFEKEVGKLAESVLGINISSPETKFSLEVQMPGIILSTSGAFSGSKAILEFCNEDLYPVGRALTVESVLYDEESLRALTGKSLVTRQNIQLATAFLALNPQAAEKVLHAVREGISAKSLDPIRAVRKELSPDEAKRLDSILQIVE